MGYICVEYNFMLRKILFMFFIERLTKLFHILRHGDDKTLVKPKKQSYLQGVGVLLGAAVFLGSLVLMIGYLL